MDYWVIYLFVKLDDIRSVFQQDGGLIFLALAITVASFLFKFLPDSEDSVSDDAKNALRSKPFKWSVCALVFLTIFTISVNFIVAFIPSTGQMAAIYLGGKATQSEAAEILSRLPEKYAKIIESKADQWLAEQDIGEIVESAVDKVTEAK